MKLVHESNYSAVYRYSYYTYMRHGSWQLLKVFVFLKLLCLCKILYVVKSLAFQTLVQPPDRGVSEAFVGMLEQDSVPWQLSVLCASTRDSSEVTRHHMGDTTW